LVSIHAPGAWNEARGDMRQRWVCRYCDFHMSHYRDSGNGAVCRLSGCRVVGESTRRARSGSHARINCGSTANQFGTTTEQPRFDRGALAILRADARRVPCPSPRRNEGVRASKSLLGAVRNLPIPVAALRLVLLPGRGSGPGPIARARARSPATRPRHPPWGLGGQSTWIEASFPFRGGSAVRRALHRNQGSKAVVLDSSAGRPPAAGARRVLHTSRRRHALEVLLRRAPRSCVWAAA
jgi:hypothetical protein